MVLINSRITFSKEICSENEFSRENSFYFLITIIEIFIVRQQLSRNILFNTGSRQI